MKVLTLQITKENFQAILKGEQKVETRNVLPTTKKRYIIEHDKEDGTLGIETIKYDALYLINGRKPNSPRLKVKVTKTEFIFEVDENDEEVYFEYEKDKYTLICWMEYSLGEVFEKENC
jgi:hypothetical protein